VSNTELAKICFQYQARLYELRRALITLGWCVSRKAGFMLSTRIDCDVDVDSSGLRQNSDKTHDLDVESKNSGQR